MVDAALSSAHSAVPRVDILIKSILLQQQNTIFRGGTIKRTIVPLEPEKEALQHV
jgi:hypothetical protein